MYPTPSIATYQVLSQMAAHISIAYSSPGINSQDLLPKSLLSRVWGEEFTMHGIPYHDDVQVELGKRFENYGAPRHERSLKASTSASGHEDALARIKDVPLEILYEVRQLSKPYRAHFSLFPIIDRYSSTSTHRTCSPYHVPIVDCAKSC
jgi:hypothetical protein